MKIPNIIQKKTRSSKSGLPPGSLVFVGEKKSDKVKIELIEYDEDGCTTKKLKKNQIGDITKKHHVTWLNVSGIHDVELLEGIGSKYDIHPLVLEDILNTSQRPKMDVYDNFIYIVLRMIYSARNGGEIISEQISLILMDGLVISFQEREGDVFDNIRDRICNNKGRIRRMREDYLAYALIDSIVDGYFGILENISDRVESLEDSLLENPDTKLLSDLHQMKRDLIGIRRSTWPMREVINAILREESKLIRKETIPYIRDLYDHTIQIIDAVEGLRDTTSGMVDLYMSSVSNKMNEIMKVLTIIATIFIPLTFIAGLYGMNFNTDSPLNMPELNWYWGYPIALGAMLIIAVIMVIYFKRKKWL